MQEIYTKTMAHEASEAYKINVRTALLDCERLGKPLTIHTVTRPRIRLIDRPTKIWEEPNDPITLKGGYTLHGGLIYYKKNAYEWRTISMDEVTAIYTDNDNGIGYLNK